MLFIIGKLGRFCNNIQKLDNVFVFVFSQPMHKNTCGELGAQVGNFLILSNKHCRNLRFSSSAQVVADHFW